MQARDLVLPTEVDRAPLRPGIDAILKQSVGHEDLFRVAERSLVKLVITDRWKRREGHSLCIPSLYRVDANRDQKPPGGSRDTRWRMDV